MRPLEKMARYIGHLNGDGLTILIPLLEVVFLAYVSLNADNETLSFHRIKKTLFFYV